MSAQEEIETKTAIPLLVPHGGTPPVIDTEQALIKALHELKSGTGAFAIDAERASGYKFSARAYLIQIKRTGGGLHLIDPIAFGPGHKLFDELNELIQSDEVILHASTQDLPCLREVGLHPIKLFDTELAGRIAGAPRVGLGPLLESLLGVSLAKEHSAVDWSTRPLPLDWLTYAALDVELLVELREKICHLLKDAHKLEWAYEEFDAILHAPPSLPRVDPWRRTSGMHKVKKRNQLAVVRQLWTRRNEIAMNLDVSPGRLLSDAAISEIALASTTIAMKNRKNLEKVLRPVGLRARWFEYSEDWISAIEQALAMEEDAWPQLRSQSDVLPPIKIWRERYPEKFAPLSHARALLEARAHELVIPLENLISPEHVRRICWNLPRGGVAQALEVLGARAWQIEIAAPILEFALLQSEPLEVEPVEVEPVEVGPVEAQ